jgi:hypothetical protein
MTQMMSPEAQTSMDQHVLTALANDALRADADGTMTYEQAEFLDTFEEGEGFTSLAEDEDGIFTEEDARDDLPNYEECVHGMALWLCADPIGHYPRDNDPYWF